MRAFNGVLLSLVLGLAAMADDKPAAKNAAGIWQGTIKVGAVELRVVVKINKKDDGSLTGTLDSPDQGAKDLALDSIVLKDDKLTFELKLAGASFEGKLNMDGKEAEGEWKQGGTAFPLVLKRTDKAPTLNRPQEPKPPYPYREEEVSYENTKAKVKFAGTLTLPQGAGPFPAVLLITGSGPQDRDETIFAHKPFKVLADHLTRKGIAVLRVDDRGVGGSTGNVSTSTTADFAEDALAGVAFLKGRKEINPKQIGLLGHSEGGIIAPLAAAQSDDIAFIVLLAGTGLPGEEILYMQGQLILKAEKASDKDLADQKRVQERIFAILKKEKDETAIKKQLAELEEELGKEVPDEKDRARMKGAMKQQVGIVLSPWFRYFLTLDPRPALGKVRCPVLAINGELDLQVPPKENLAAIQKALKEAGNTDVTVKEIAGANHLFQMCKTGKVSEYGKIEETMSPAVLELISDWVVKRTRR